MFKCARLKEISMACVSLAKRVCDGTDKLVHYNESEGIFKCVCVALSPRWTPCSASPTSVALP